MKRLTLILALLLTAQTALRAQETNTNEVTLSGTYLQPTTAIVVEITVKRHSVTTGPYARYSSQLLGVVAPLNDKQNYTIEAVKMSNKPLGSHSGVAKKNGKISAPFTNGNAITKNNFTDMGLTPVYNIHSGEKNIQTMANEAAAAIFKIRSSRFELITGEKGDAAMGAGLEAAIKEMARLEQEYLELFVGKSEVEYLTYQYEIIPESGKDNYMVCRFSDSKGIASAMDISGNPLVLNIIDENRIESNTNADSKKTAVGERVAVADIALCKIMLGSTILSERRLPIFQLGVEGTK